VAPFKQVESAIGCVGTQDGLPDLVWVTDGDLNYSYVNARSKDLLGYEPAEMVGRSMVDFLEPEESRRVSDLLSSLSAATAPFHLLEKTVRCKDGTSLVVQSSGTPLTDSRGIWLGYQGIDRDVTTRWESEKKLRDNLTSRLRTLISNTTAAKSLVEHARQLEQVNEELRRRNKQLDELRYMSSHDLQEPLRHLLIFSQRLEQHLLEGVHDKVLTDLEAIRRSASRMRRTILSVQELTSIEQALLHIQPVPLDRCVRQALDSLDGVSHGCDVVIGITDMPTVLADESLTVALFRHLVGNALKFSPRPVKVKITAEQADGDWIFGVRDDGPGVDAQYFDRIFRPFERIGPKRNDGSSGMGLAICRAIVERHGGEIWVESTVGQGAHFKFRFELKDASQTERRDCPGSKDAGNL
jgi:PAS domain S-box-containing protein